MRARWRRRIVQRAAPSGTALSEWWAFATAHRAMCGQGSKAIVDGPVRGSTPQSSHIGKWKSIIPASRASAAHDRRRTAGRAHPMAAR
eukprot:7726314-Alexandrium_andersonii.AAC.1